MKQESLEGLEAVFVSTWKSLSENEVNTEEEHRDKEMDS